VASSAAHTTIQHRFKVKYPHIKLPPCEEEQLSIKVSEFLRLEERSTFFTIDAHRYEHEGNLDKARGLFEDACRQNFHGNNEQRDLQRFLKKHDLSPRKERLLPPEKSGQHRRFKLKCNPQEEAGQLQL